MLVHKDKVIEHLSVDGERLTTTPEHPFYTKEQGWVPAGQLKADMHVREADGSWGVVQGFMLEHHTQRMFNLTVDDAHTFFVGERQLLVHMGLAHSTTSGIVDRLERHGLDGSSRKLWRGLNQ